MSQDESWVCLSSKDPAFFVGFLLHLHCQNEGHRGRLRSKSVPSGPLAALNQVNGGNWEFGRGTTEKKKTHYGIVICKPTGASQSPMNHPCRLTVDMEDLPSWQQLTFYGQSHLR